MSIYVIAEIPFTDQVAQDFTAWTKSENDYPITKSYASYELIQTLLAEDKKTIHLYGDGHLNRSSEEIFTQKFKSFIQVEDFLQTNKQFEILEEDLQNLPVMGTQQIS